MLRVIPCEDPCKWILRSRICNLVFGPSKMNVNFYDGGHVSFTQIAYFLYLIFYTYYQVGFIYFKTYLYLEISPNNLFMNKTQKIIFESSFITLISYYLNSMFHENQFNRINLSNSRHSSLVSKQLEQLSQRRNLILLKDKEQNQYRHKISTIRNEISIQHSQLLSKQNQIKKINNLIEDFNNQIANLNQEKITIVITIQDCETHLNFLTQSLIQFYKPNMTEVDQLRLKLIQQEGSSILKQAEPTFSIRKAIIVFLKDHGLLKQHYKWGIELQISAKNRAEQFKWFTIELLKMCHHPDQANMIKAVNDYAKLLISAQKLIKSDTSTQFMVAQGKTDEINIKISKQRAKIGHLQCQLKQNSDKIKDITNRKQEMNKLLKNIEAEVHEIRIKLETLRQKMRSLEINLIGFQNVESELAQIDQAIEYFNLKNAKSQVQSSTLINSHQEQMYSPSSSISLPPFNDSIFKSLLKSPSNTTISRTKKVEKTESLRKFSSPLRWK